MGGRSAASASASSSSGSSQEEDDRLHFAEDELLEAFIAAASSGNNSATSVTHISISSGLDGQTALSTPLLYMGALTSQVEEAGNASSGSGSWAAWNLEWELDNELGTRDNTATYLLEISISHSGSAAYNPQFLSGQSYTFGNFGDSVTILAGDSYIEVSNVYGDWMSTDGIFSNVHTPQAGNLEIVVTKEVELSVGDSVAVLGLVSFQATGGISGGTYLGSSDVLVDVKATPINP